MIDVAGFDTMKHVRDDMLQTFSLYRVCTRAEFDKHKDEFAEKCKCGDIVCISDGDEEFIYCGEDQWTEIGLATTPSTPSHVIKITRCISCNAPLDLNKVSDGGVCRCGYCGNWNLVYEDHAND